MKVKVTTTRGNILTPCIGTCKIDQKSEQCSGCRRTRKEIGEWRRMSQEQRREVIAQLEVRH